MNKREALQNLKLVCPYHLEMVNNGNGEFPDTYKLTEKGINKILELLTNLSLLEAIEGEIELAEEPKEYSEKIILESIKTLITQNKL